MKKRILWLLPLVVLGSSLFPRWEGSRNLDPVQRLRTALLLNSVRSIAPNASTDDMESFFMEKGLPVLDSDAHCPTYLANSREFLEFCQGKKQSAQALRCLEGGGVRQLLFLRQGEDVWFYTTGPDPEDGRQVTRKLPVCDMTLSERGIFYYRCYPEGDPHYIDYSEIRLNPPDREGYDLLRTYILPVGYQMVNLFLTDWQEGQWDSVSLTDTLEFLYTMNTGDSLPWESWEGSTSEIFVPGQLFEDTILSRFSLTVQQLRRYCRYHPETGCYSWRPVHGDQLVTWEYPMCDPELVSCRDNPDGTLTLEIRVFSPDKRGALLFSHEVTLRLLEDGFQYVGNRVTETGEYGLPVTLPRFQLGYRLSGS